MTKPEIKPEEKKPESLKNRNEFLFLYDIKN